VIDGGGVDRAVLAMCQRHTPALLGDMLVSGVCGGGDGRTRDWTGLATGEPSQLLPFRRQHEEDWAA